MIREGQLSARFVVLDAGRVLSPGRVVWDADGRIVATHRVRGPVDDVAVLPGLVDAHVHLQIPALDAPSRQFLPWVSQVLAARAGAKAADHRRHAAQSLRTLLAEGTTAVGEIDSTGDSLSAMAGSPIEGRCYREVLGYHLRGRAAGAHVEACRAARRDGVRVGLSPHAPYSVSDDLLRAAARRSARLQVHCAELPEEQQFLRTGRGPFAELLRRLGRLPDDHRAPGVGAVRWIERLGALRRGTVLVHCQELERGDVARIARSGASIAVCPGTIEHFRRAAPDVPRWRAAGIRVALGTDSAASNTGLSMRSELRRAARLWPSLRPQELLEMATSAGGAALGVPCGALRRGRRADLVVVPAAGDLETTLARFVHDELPALQVRVAGVRVRTGERR